MNSRNRNPLSTSPRLLSDLVDRHAARLVLYARQICSEPEDVVQEAFLELFEPPVQPENLTAWLFRVVRNRLMKTLEDEDVMAKARSFLVKEAGDKGSGREKDGGDTGVVALRGGSV
ncbi:MAG: sigma factor [Planctomycetota bacterium]|nr:sigma factor [Planctomycetota bacterium]MDA1247842.1 sigma factor [Planctomycetota bacterium]